MTVCEGNLDFKFESHGPKQFGVICKNLNRMTKQINGLVISAQKEIVYHAEARQQVDIQDRNFRRDDFVIKLKLIIRK